MMMSGKIKLLMVLAAAVLLVVVFLLVRQVENSLIQQPVVTDPLPTIPRATLSPDATVIPGFSPDEFPIIPVG